MSQQSLLWGSRVACRGALDSVSLAIPDDSLAHGWMTED
jgi:hypothetical protein